MWVEQLYSTFTTDYKTLHLQQHRNSEPGRAPEIWILRSDNLQKYVKAGQTVTVWPGRGERGTARIVESRPRISFSDISVHSFALAYSAEHGYYLT
jgi:hypothetical protein